MAATVNTAGGRFTAVPKRRRPGTRRKLSPSMQWLLSFLLMIVIFATYFVLCLLLTPYNLFSMTLTARKVILAILVILLVGLTTVLCIFGDWKRPLIAFLICLMLYIPANFSKIPEIVEATGAPEGMIKKMIREGRFEQIGVKMSYPCEKCGAPIITGKICQSCQEEVHKELQKKASAITAAKQAAKQQAHGHGMYSKNKLG